MRRLRHPKPSAVNALPHARAWGCGQGRQLLVPRLGIVLGRISGVYRHDIGMCLRICRGMQGGISFRDQGYILTIKWRKDPKMK